MTAGVVGGLVAAGLVSALAFGAAWLTWRTAPPPESVRTAVRLTGVGVGALSGPALAALLTALTGDTAFAEQSGLFAGGGVAVGGAAGHGLGKRIGRPSGRPTQGSEDYRDPVPWDEFR